MTAPKGGPSCQCKTPTVCLCLEPQCTTAPPDRPGEHCQEHSQGCHVGCRKSPPRRKPVR